MKCLAYIVKSSQMKCVAYIVKSWWKKQAIATSEAAAETSSLRLAFP